MQQALATVATLVMLSAVAAFVTRLSAGKIRLVWLGVFVCVVGGGVTMMTTHAYVARWGIRYDIKSDGLSALMDGTANRPFVFRRLAPDLVTAATHFADTRLPKRLVDDFLERSMLVKRYGSETFTRRESIAFHSAYFLVWLSSFLSILAGAALLRAVCACPTHFAVIAAILGMSLIPLTLSAGGYIYDAPELLLWTTFLAVAVGARLEFLPLVFALMALNKESVLIAVPCAFPLLSRRVGVAGAIKWSCLFAVIGAGWLFYVRSKYAHVAGDNQSFFLWGNLRWWTQPLNYLRVAPLFAPALQAPRGGNLLLLLLFLIPMRFGWPQLRRDVQWAARIMTLELVPLFLVSGASDETRALSLLFPFLLVIAVLGFAEMFRRQSSPPVSA